MSCKVILFVLAAAACNVVTVFCLKESKGMSRCSPTMGVVLSILACHWALAQALECGGRVGIAIALNVVVVVLASGLIGYFYYGEEMSFWQIVGLMLAATGILLALALGGGADAAAH